MTSPTDKHEIERVVREGSEFEAAYTNAMSNEPIEAVALGQISTMGEIWTTCGWSSRGPAWVTERQIPPTVGYGWTRTGKTAEFQGQTLIELVRTLPVTGDAELIERLREAVRPLNDIPPSVQSMSNLRIVEAAHAVADRLQALTGGQTNGK